MSPYMACTRVNTESTFIHILPGSTMSQDLRRRSGQLRTDHAEIQRDMARTILVRRITRIPSRDVYHS